MQNKDSYIEEEEETPQSEEQEQQEFLISEELNNFINMFGKVMVIAMLMIHYIAYNGFL
jgi:TATA-binding protein-associated factor Taf7